MRKLFVKLFVLLDMGLTMALAAIVLRRLRQMPDDQRAHVLKVVQIEARRPREPVTIDGECKTISEMA